MFPSLEEAIVQACLLRELLPTTSFQQAVHSLFSLLLLHPMVAISGSPQSGKSSCVQAAVETLRLLGYSLQTHALSIEALEPNELFGHPTEGG